MASVAHDGCAFTVVFLGVVDLWVGAFGWCVEALVLDEGEVHLASAVAGDDGGAATGVNALLRWTLEAAHPCSLAYC